MVKNMLNMKLLRDMRRSAMQFVALIFLCVLGTFLFTGIDSIASMIQLTNDTYFEQNHLADFWVTVPRADRDALLRVQSLPGVKKAIARFSVEMESTLPSKPMMNLTGYDGAMTINEPILQSGEALQTSDKRGCLLQAGFANAHGLRVGDSLTVKQNGTEHSFVIRGICYSPEFVSVSSSGFPADTSNYGYMLVNTCALPQIPLQQMPVLTDGTVPLDDVAAAIRSALPNALVAGRAAHQSTAAVQENVQMFRKISYMFPVAAFAVSALIVMTTLTRMIENQRVPIGTMKSLGFSQKKIRGHYLAYAIWPALIGSLLGVVAGYYTVPELIWVLLIGHYEYPYQLMPNISLAAFGLVLFSVGVSVGICLYAYGKTTKEPTAYLLRTKPPKDGKRLFFERITFLWKRFSFNTKMVLRNLLRNKMRTLMSCIGLLCCNVLIIASIGLQDSIVIAADNHYSRALGYDLLVTLNEKAGSAAAYKHRLKAAGVESIMERPARVFSESMQRISKITVTENNQTMLKLGKNESYVPMPETGAAITEKLAKTLQMSVGDTLYLQLAGDDELVYIPVASIVVNNYSQGVYMTQATWESLRKGPFYPTHIQLLEPSPECVAELKDMEEVVKTQTTTTQKQEFLDTLDMISSVFFILMVIALALAFVICYNMGLINFAERTREYATLKVLGYHKKEIRKLIVNENTLITVIALALSVYPGIGFTGAILAMVESESALYTAHVLPATIAISSAVTFLFSYFIQLLLVRKVQGIVMVEALKSNE